MIVMNNSKKIRYILFSSIVVCVIIFLSVCHMSKNNDNVIVVSDSILTNDSILLENNIIGVEKQEVFSSDYSYQVFPEDDESKEMAETCIEVLKKWNEGLSNHDPSMLKDVYSSVVSYYQTDLEYDEIERIQAKYFKKRPQCRQYVKDVSVSFINSFKATVEFVKYVQEEPDSEIKVYPSYLKMDCSHYDKSALIEAESDSLTDANVSKRKIPEVVNVTNDMELDEIFCDSNVGKRIEVSYWDLVGLVDFDSEPVEGPLAKAMVNATDFCRVGLCGTLKKNYKGNANIYYCVGHISAGEAGWDIIWIYDKTTCELTYK